ncbi:MAG: hypothetical protein ABFS35_22050 [Bacteroidota bacterium]
MEGEEILNSIIDKTLEDGRIQSFILNGELVDRINVTFLKFNKWINIVSTDEITTVRIEESSFENIKSYGDKKFYYPIEQTKIYFPEFEKYIGKKLFKWKELVWTKDKKLSFGINLYFENNLNLIIHNQDYPIDKNQYIFKNSIPKDLIEK